MSKETSEKKTSETPKKPNKFVKWFKDLKSEFKKVVWPTKQTVINNTFVVLVTMLITSAFVGGLDYGLLSLIELALKG